MLSRLAKGSCSTWPEKGLNGPRLTAWADSELQVSSKNQVPKRILSTQGSADPKLT